MEKIFRMTGDLFEKMHRDNSWLVGVAGGLITIPTWLTSKEFLVEHWILMFLLISVLFIDYLAGSRLAKLSPVMQKNSSELFDCLVRDFIIICICAAGYGFDYLIGTGSMIYTICICAFFYQNLYSFVANVAVLGWEDKFPLWLFKWLKDEIDVKKEKYFPEQKEE